MATGRNPDGPCILHRSMQFVTMRNATTKKSIYQLDIYLSILPIMLHHFRINLFLSITIKHKSRNRGYARIRGAYLSRTSILFNRSCHQKAKQMNVSCGRICTWCTWEISPSYSCVTTISTFVFDCYW
jgi:hypothetical protein